ncbi:MAG: Transcription antitermination protein NusB [Gemmatimonadaceae bacterium]|nr:Transcription antitermination protein NusB [Gemmatimonadaceae bacterium]
MTLTRSDQRTRRRARARALQALYAWDVTGADELLRLTHRLWDDLAVGADERDFAGPVLRFLDRERAAIDRQIEDVTTNWRLERIGAIERCVLRLGVAELSLGDVPTKATIQESVRLAEMFGSDDSAKFVNGVLDAVARRLGRL